MDDTRPKEFIRHGIQVRRDAGSIGGVDSLYDADGRPIVVLAAMPEEGGFTDHELHEGDTFELGSEQWRVTEIGNPNTERWFAVLTQVR